MKRVAIAQSNYIPWKGYFDLIAQADEFLILDEVQYTKQDWRNRNVIKAPTGPQWLTIPVSFSLRNQTPVDRIVVSDERWAAKHWTTLTRNYVRAPHFDIYNDLFSRAFLAAPTNLSQINRMFINMICEILTIDTTIRTSDGLSTSSDKNERLIEICRSVGADTYLSGPAAKSYLDEDRMAAAGIAVEWVDYSGYAAYPQLWGEFTHQVTILDLLFNCGPDAGRYMKYVGE